MSEKYGHNYIVRSGDTNDSIVKHFVIQNWAEIYNHPNNQKVREKYGASDQIKPDEIIWIPSRNVQPTKTGTSHAVQQPTWRFFFNAHMHIQSNNCCPMPLQWGILTKAIHAIPVLNLFIQERSCSSRKKTNEMARGVIGTITTGRLGKIGVLSTDLIAGVYKHDLKDQDMREDMVWAVMDEEEYEALKKRNNAAALTEAGKKAKLRSLGAETDKSFKDSFYMPTEYYYHNCPLTMFNAALLMDMSLAHYWGRWNIPVTIDWGTQAVYINDWCAAYVLPPEKDDTGYEWEAPERIEGHVIEPTGYSPRYRHIFAKATRDKDFSLEKAWEQFNARQQKKPGAAVNSDMIIMTFNSEKDTDLCAKEFVHIIDQIPGGTGVSEDGKLESNEIKWFEDYKLQKKLSEGAAVKYPLEFFLFYHYDPRRHCGGLDAEAYAADQAKEIIAKHAFYRYQQSLQSGPDEPTMMVPDEKLNDGKNWEKILKNTIMTNKEALDSLFFNNESGIYWGVKTYPRLGYDPGDFIKYPQLREFYQECGSDVPIMTHCSRGGMAGADYYCYAKYDQSAPGLIGKEKERYDAISADPSSLERTEYWFTDTFAAPANWEKVMNQFPSLRLCLAHFGGYDTWCQVGVFEDIEALYPVNPGIFPKGEAIEKTAENEKMRATLYHAWIKKIAELADSKENLYTDLSYFHLGSDLYASDIRLKNRETDVDLLDMEAQYSMIDCKKLVAKNIVYLLGKFTNLKKKIIIGTDWYMIERENQKGVGDILRNLFIVMEMVSEKVGYDAWHQFAVVNPMRYLGVGKEDDKGEKMVIGKERLEKYGEVLQNKFIEKKWVEDSRINTVKSHVKDQVTKMIERVSSFPSVPLKRESNK